LKKENNPKARYPFPREHGAYIVLLSAWLLAVLRSAGNNILHALLMLLFLISIFFLQAPITAAWNRRSLAQLGAINKFWLYGICLAAIGTALLLLSIQPTFALVAMPATVIASVYAFMPPSRFGMGERSVIGFLLLTLAAPCTQLVLVNPPIGQLLEIWLIAASYFCGSAMNIRLRISKPNDVTRKNDALRQSTMYHLLMLTLTCILAVGKYIGWTAFAATALSTFRLLWIAEDRNRFSKLPLKRIGLQESVLAVVFLLINMPH
jgi:hypothetical protein